MPVTGREKSVSGLFARQMGSSREMGYTKGTAYEGSGTGERTLLIEVRVDLAVVGILVLGDDALVVAAVDAAVRLGSALAALVHEVLQLVVLPAVDEVCEEISVSTPRYSQK